MALSCLDGSSYLKKMAGCRQVLIDRRHGPTQCDMKHICTREMIVSGRCCSSGVNEVSHKNE